MILEVKQSALSVADEKQLLNYLKATDLEVGLLFNFGPTPKAPAARVLQLAQMISATSACPASSA
ncbi:MAG: GxxExxY protein [Gemmatimonadaceae bacterium]